MPETLPFRSRQEIEQAALELLNRFGMLKVPVDPIALANRLGAKVFHAKFSDDSIAGMLSQRGDSITMLINQSDPAYRKRFTIAHELGHHVLHLPIDDGHVINTTDLYRVALPDSPDAPGTRQRAEIQANQFAAALLMPEPLLKELQKTVRNPAQLARVFQVSEDAMAIRLNTLGLV